MIIQRDNKKFSFFNFGSKEPTTNELREELETVYKFIDEDVSRLVKQLDSTITDLKSRIETLETE